MKKRYVYIDIIKAFAIFLVVFGHVIQFWLWPDSWWNEKMFLLIYSFHMPLFMMLSGLVVGMCRKPLTCRKFILRRFRQLMIPYLSWAFIDCMRKSNLEIVNIVVYPNNFLWFLWALFFISIFTEACLHINEKKRRILGYVFLLFLLFIVDKLLCGKFALDKIKYLSVFYIFGIEFCQQEYYKYIIKKSISCFPLWLLMAFYYRWGGNYDSSLINYVYAVTMAFAGCLSFISLLFLLKDVFNMKYIKQIGQSTLGIYAVHYLFIDALVVTVKLNGTIIIAVISAFCMVLLSLFTIKLIKKNKVLSFLLLGIKNEKR